MNEQVKVILLNQAKNVGVQFLEVAGKALLSAAEELKSKVTIQQPK